MFKKDLGLLVLILVVGAAVALINPRFISPINLSNTANLIGLFGLFSIAEAFVIISGGIELSVGSVIALLGVVFVDLIANQGVPWLVALPIVIGLGVVMGAVHGLLVTKLRIQPFVVTLCGLLIYRGIARYYTDDATAGFAFGVNFPLLEWLTTGRTYGIPHSLIAFAVIALAMGVLLHRTVFGRYLFAVGKNEEAARYSGIRTHRVIIAAYVICIGLTALAAVFIAMYTRSISPASHGNFYELYAIAAAVLGGCSLRGGEGSILGVVLGTILLQVLQNLVNLLGIPSSLNFAVIGGVILVGVIADQQFMRYRQSRASRRVTARAEERGAPALGAVLEARIARLGCVWVGMGARDVVWMALRCRADRRRHIATRATRDEEGCRPATFTMRTCATGVRAMDVVDWLLDSDPSIRWQVMRDLTGEPDEVVAAERARVATEGWGARLLGRQTPDGGWGEVGYTRYIDSPDGQSLHALILLRDMGLDPASAQARLAVARVRDHITHYEGGQPFFEGETEACINGRVLTAGRLFRRGERGPAGAAARRAARRRRLELRGAAVRALLVPQHDLRPRRAAGIRARQGRHRRGHRGPGPGRSTICWSATCSGRCHRVR